MDHEGKKWRSNEPPVAKTDVNLVQSREKAELVWKRPVILNPTS